MYFCLYIIYIFKNISLLTFIVFFHDIPVLQLISDHFPENFVLRLMEGDLAAARLHHVGLDVDVGDDLVKVSGLTSRRHAQHGGPQQHALLLPGDEDVHVEDVCLGLQEEAGVCNSSTDSETVDAVSDLRDGVDDVPGPVAEGLDGCEVESGQLSLQGQTHHGASHGGRRQGGPDGVQRRQINI